VPRHEVAGDVAVYRGRFAPSPTGPLHAGSLLAAFGSWLLARHAAGQWLVRIEDLDPPRETIGAIERQLRMLAASGLDSDGPILRQSRRHGYYRAALEMLLDTGEAFVCHCSRTTLAEATGIHRKCTPHAHRSDPAIRFRVQPGSTVTFDDRLRGRITQDASAEAGDFVLRRADGLWAYQLAVAVDDAAQDITEVARGADLLASTGRQILLQRALGVRTPRYAHLPLVLDDRGRKLSKSLVSAPVDDRNPMPALRSAWQALGQPALALADAASIADLIAIAPLRFDPELIPRQDPAPAGNEVVTGSG
jgi:glutamyl-Q tRNA(Asp) synthetase